jgi:hypothetical protein
MLFRSEGLQVGVVSPDGKVELTRVIPGKDFGTGIEVLSGLSETDKVIVNPPDSLAAGMTVHVSDPAR